jgi:polyamine oxidase
VIDQAGYKQVILRHAAEIPNINQKVHLNQVITSVSYTNSSVTATTKSGLTIRAKKAICTFSLGVLQHSDVTFSPQLPSSKLEAIANFHMATYTKIFARFRPEDKFWNETEFWLYADPDERGYYPLWQPLDITGFLPGSGIVFATLTGQQAIRAEHQSDEEVKREFLTVLRRLYGEDKVPEPVEFTFPRWTRDPLFRGTFTNYGAGVTTEQQEALKAPVGGDHDRERTLWFAGEHTSRKHFGYLHGAFREGRSSAGEVADCLLRGCQKSEETLIAKRDAEEFMDLSHAGKRKRMYVSDYA